MHFLVKSVQLSHHRYFFIFQKKEPNLQDSFIPNKITKFSLAKILGLRMKKEREGERKRGTLDNGS
jgi:hypothetical protein